MANDRTSDVDGRLRFGGVGHAAHRVAGGLPNRGAAPDGARAGFHAVQVAIERHTRANWSALGQESPPTITLPNYDVSPDGRRFVMVKEESTGGRLHVVLNWLEELKRLVPIN